MAISFKHGVLSSYLSKPESISGDVLYFITDTGRLYKGDKLIATKGTEYGTTLPTTGFVSGDMFALTSKDGEKQAGLYKFNGSTWDKFTDNDITALETKLTEALSGIGTTSGSVKDYVDTAIAGVNAAGLGGKIDFISGVLSGYSAVESVKTAIDGKASSSDVTALGSRVSTVQSVISAFTAEGSISAAIDDVIGNLNTVSGNLKTVSGDLDTAESNISTLSTNLNTVSGDLDKVEDILSGYTTAASVSAAIAAIDAKSGVSAVTLEKLTSEADISGWAAAYQLKVNGSAIGDKINIPKDQFLKSATFHATAETGVTTTAPYLKFVWELSGGVTTPTYVPVGDLVDTYTAGSGVVIANNVIDAKIDNSTITFTAASGLQVGKITSANIDGNISNSIVEGLGDAALRNVYTNFSNTSEDQILTGVSTVSGVIRFVQNSTAQTYEVTNSGKLATVAQVSAAIDALDVNAKTTAKIDKLNDASITGSTLIPTLGVSGNTLVKSDFSFGATTSGDFGSATEVAVESAVSSYIAAQLESYYTKTSVDGLISGKMNFVDASASGQVLIADTDGDAKASGAKLGADGNTALSGTFMLATEAAVKAYVDSAVSTASTNANSYADSKASSTVDNALTWGTI